MSNNNTGNDEYDTECYYCDRIAELKCDFCDRLICYKHKKSYKEEYERSPDGIYRRLRKNICRDCYRDATITNFACTFICIIIIMTLSIIAVFFSVILIPILYIIIPLYITFFYAAYRSISTKRSKSKEK